MERIKISGRNTDIGSQKECEVVDILLSLPKLFAVSDMRPWGRRKKRTTLRKSRFSYLRRSPLQSKTRSLSPTTPLRYSPGGSDKSEPSTCSKNLKIKFVRSCNQSNDSNSEPSSKKQKKCCMQPEKPCLEMGANSYTGMNFDQQYHQLTMFAQQQQLFAKHPIPFGSIYNTNATQFQPLYPSTTRIVNYQATKEARRRRMDINRLKGLLGCRR